MTSATLPLVTIITPSYNQGEFIRQTIESVLSQDYLNLEYWVIDGGSTDDTVDILKSFGNKIHWISKKDAGQADAINKGFALAKGEIIAWLNSDDFYERGAIKKVVNFFVAHDETDCVYGDMNFVDREGRHPKLCTYLSDFSLLRLLKYCYICQPAVFFRTKVVKKLGRMSNQYRYVFDYDYWLRMGESFPGRIVRVHLGPLANLRTYPTRKTEAGLIPMRREVIVLMLKHGYWYAPAILESLWLITKSNFEKK